MSTTHVIRGFLVSSLLSLVACGGGGGGGGASSGGGGAGGGGTGGTLSLGVTELTFIADGPSAPTPLPQLVSGSVTGFSGSTLYLRIVGSGAAIESISGFTTTETSGQAMVYVPPPSALGVGIHSGVITVSACTTNAECRSGHLSGSPRTINVTYYVADLQASRETLQYSVNNGTSVSALDQQITISGVPAQSWKATSNVPWLSVTASGITGGTITASLAQQDVEAITNGTYEGLITIEPQTAGPVLQIPVSLQIRRTQINHVSPYVAYQGDSGNVIIRGEEFSQVTVQGVRFGAHAADSFTVVSPTEIRATYPASIPLGRHRIQLQSDFDAVREFAELVVVDAPAFAATVLQYPSSQERAVNALIYDAERASIAVSTYVLGPTELVHFSSSNGAWQQPTAIALTNNFGLALSTDASEWIAGADKTVVHIDADDLTTVATVTTPLFPSGTLWVAEMATANDGQVAMFGDVTYGCGSALMLYDVRKRIFSQPDYTACRGNIGGSSDGSRLLIANQFPEFSTDDVLSLDVSTGTLTPTGVHMFTGAQPQLDRTGSRIVLNRTSVYDGQYSYLGALPATTLAVVLSPDGDRAYTYDQSGLMRTYDLVGAPIQGSFQEIGVGTALAGQPGLDREALYTDAAVMMTITPDGNTVFIAGSDAVIVQPTP